MKLTLLHKILQLAAVTKALTYKKGSLMLLSLPLSFGVVEAFQSLFKNVQMYNLVLPIASITACVGVYGLFWVVDFLTGLAASRFEQKNDPDWVKSDKLYSSFGKIGGVLLLDTLLIVIIIFLTVIAFEKSAFGLLLISVSINILAILFEFQSIGENIKRRTNSKPRYFTFFDKLTNLLEEIILKKFKSIFGAEAMQENSKIDGN